MGFAISEEFILEDLDWISGMAFSRPFGISWAIEGLNDQIPLLLFSNGQIYGPYDFLKLISIFSYNENVWKAYGIKKNEELIIFENGEEFGPFSHFITRPISTADGWLALIHKGIVPGVGPLYSIVTSEGEEFGPFTQATIYTSYESPDVNVWMAQVEEYGKYWILTSEGDRLGPYDFLKGPVLSENGEDWIIATMKRGKKIILTSRQEEYGFFEEVEKVSISPDGSKWAAVVEKVGKMIINPYGNDLPLHPLFQVRDLFVSNEGDWIARGEQGLGREFILDSQGNQFGPFKLIWDFSVSTDRKFWAAVVEENGRHWFINSFGQKIDLYNPYIAKVEVGWENWILLLNYPEKGWFLLTSEEDEWGPYDFIEYFFIEGELYKIAYGNEISKGKWSFTIEENFGDLPPMSW